MPTVSLIKDELFDKMEKQYTDDEFQDLCFAFGIELDEITSEYEMAIAAAQGNKKAGDGKSKEIIYKIDIPANRYDLLCLEGLSRALRIYLELEVTPIFKAVTPSLNNGPRQQMIVKQSTSSIRPYVVCAVLRNLSFTPVSYQSFIKLQEHLHFNICRRRTYVAIGTHDFDTIEGPFRYEAKKPEDISFVPLTEKNGKVYNGKELMDFYREDKEVKHLREFTDIIYDSPVYPVIYDSQDRVLSLPPIINGDHSKITLDTKNVFIECTATDKTKANIVLDTVIAMFSEYCEEKFTAEMVDIVYEEDGHIETTPLLSTRNTPCTIDEINGTIGVDLDPEYICELCAKMQLGPVTYHSDEPGKKPYINVTVPPTRSDILHPVDIIEDVAIAYGYGMLYKDGFKTPATNTVGKPLPINSFSDLIREEVARAGYSEILTYGLCCWEDVSEKLNRPRPKACEIANAEASLSYEIVRSTLIPGVLSCIKHNKMRSFADGFKLFEVNDIVLLDDTTDTGAKNHRRIVACYSGPDSGFSIIHGLVDRVMMLAEIGPDDAYAGNSKRPEYEYAVHRSDKVYTIQASADPLFFNGRCVDIILIDKTTGTKTKVGVFGTVHPKVLKNYELSCPVSLLEFDLEPLM